MPNTLKPRPSGKANRPVASSSRSGNSEPALNCRPTESAELDELRAQVSKLQDDLNAAYTENEKLATNLEAQNAISNDEITDFENMEQRLMELEGSLDEQHELNARLQERVEELEAEAAENPNYDSEQAAPTMIKRPKGTAGQHWSIQTEMGLAGSEKKTEIYKGLGRALRDLVLNARISWKSPWAEIPASDKSLLFQLARDRLPFLKRFVNDWATEEIVKQFMKNRRKNHYRKGWLDVPERYSHLKANSDRRDPSGSRVKKAKVVLAAKKRGKQAAVAARRPVAERESDE